MKFDELIRYKALHFKYVADNQGFMDLIANEAVENNVPMKNVCAMVHQPLFDELTNLCGLLDISKRAFVEAALVEALDRTHKIIDEEGVNAYLDGTIDGGLRLQAAEE